MTARNELIGEGWVYVAPMTVQMDLFWEAVWDVRRDGRSLHREQVRARTIRELVTWARERTGNVIVRLDEAESFWAGRGAAPSEVEVVGRIVLDE